MAEIRTVTTLTRKRDEIEAAITNYEKRLAQARADLAHINAAIAIFEASGDPDTLSSYVDLHRLFRYGEIGLMCKAALVTGPKNTREIATFIIKTRGLDPTDRVLAKSMAKRLIHSLRQLARRGKIVAGGKFKAARIWRLP